MARPSPLIVQSRAATSEKQCNKHKCNEGGILRLGERHIIIAVRGGGGAEVPRSLVFHIGRLGAHLDTRVGVGGDCLVVNL